MKPILTLLLLLLSLSTFAQLPAVDMDEGNVYTINSGLAALSGTVDNYIYLPQSLALFSRMETQPPVITKRSIDEVIDTAISCGAWDNFYAFYGYAVNNVDNAKLNWIDDTFNITLPEAANRPFFFINKGFEGNVAGGYLNTGFNPSNYPTFASNSSIGIKTEDHNVYSSAIATRRLMGGDDGTNYIMTRLGQGGNYLKYTTYASTSANNVTTTNIASTKGFFHFVRKADSLNIYYNNTKNKNKVTLASSPNKTLDILGENAATSHNPGTQVTVSFAYISRGLTTSQIAKINWVCNKYMTNISKPETVYENNEMYYKLANGYGCNAIRIIFQDGNNVISTSGDSIYLSIDGGATYSHKKNLAGADSVRSAFMFNNGKIKIFKRRTAYQSNDSLKSLTVQIVYRNGSAYTPHTPASATYPGNYYMPFSQISSNIAYNGREVMCFGNYANIWGGASPLNMIYCVNGDSLKVGYLFGQNTAIRDDGTEDGGATGTLLGDASNSETAKHIHFVHFSPYDTSIYMGTGDTEAESDVFRGKFNAGLTALTWTKIGSNAVNGRFKTADMAFVSDSAFLLSDDNLKSDHGLFKFKLSEISNIAKHTKILNCGISYYLQRSENDMIVQQNERIFYVSRDNGNTWSSAVYLSEIPSGSWSFHNWGFAGKANSDGWYSVSDCPYPIGEANNRATILFKLK